MMVIKIATKGKQPAIKTGGEYLVMPEGVYMNVSAIGHTLDGFNNIIKQHYSAIFPNEEFDPKSVIIRKG